VKKHVVWLLPLFLTLAACSGRFQNKDLDSGDLSPVESDDAPTVTQYQDPSGTYQIVRYSKAISLKQVQTKNENGQFTVSADLTFNGKNEGPVELVGEPPKENSGETVLVPKDPALQDKFKAKVTCTSDDDSCSQYFIDFFAKDGKTFYVDQYVQDASQDASDAAVAAPASPLTTTTSTTTSTTTTSTTVKKNSAKTEATAAPVDDEEEDIPEATAGRYVGTSDKDIVSYFENQKITPKIDPQMTAPPITVPPIHPTITPPQKPVLPPKPPAKSVPQEQMGDTDQPQTINQAVNLPSAGRLQNATNLLELVQDENYPLKIMWPAKKRYYSTLAMASFLRKLGEFMQTMIPNYKLILSDVSTQHGGQVITNGHPGHKGHQNGNDADISYVVKDSTAVLTTLVNGKKLSRELMLKEQWALLKEAYKTGQVAIIFMDPVIKHALCYEAQQEGDLRDRADRGVGYETLRRIYPLAGHANHFHVRIKCGAGDSTCRDQNWRYRDSGCFSTRAK
jgi:penicillin-insensitive murein endopeptidase